MKRALAGLNGVGRFGSHLLRYWLVNYKDSSFDIEFINDEILSIDQAIKLLENDPHFDFYSIEKLGNEKIRIYISKDFSKDIIFTNSPLENISWAGKPVLFFECSGKYSNRESWKDILIEHTKFVVISASATNVDQLLVYGHNHETYAKESRVISYGSCTINAFVPLANKINELFEVIESDVQVIHNVPHHKINERDLPKKQECTLEKFGPRLLDFLNKDNFSVNYTLVPYTGVSLIDMRFKISSPLSEDKIIDSFKRMVASDLKDLYALTDKTKNANDHKFTNYSAVIVKDTLRMVGDNLYVYAYFDNENSVNRYFDLINYICWSQKI